MNTRFWLWLCPLVLINLLFLSSSSTPAVLAQTLPATPHDSPLVNPARVSTALAHTPVMFIENAGQFDAGARFQVRGGDGALFLADDALWVTLFEKPKADAAPAPELHDPTRANAPQANTPQKGVNLRLSFVGANPQPHLEPFDRLDTHVSYFTGSDASQWHPDVPVWGGVRYKDLYPGIDLELTSENGQMVQRFVAREGANLDAVQLRVEGADVIDLGNETLRLKTAVGEYAMPLFEMRGVASDRVPQPALAENVVRAPFVKSKIGNQKSEINNASALLYATFLGGEFYNQGNGIITDSAGNAYVAGRTSAPYFPTTPGAFQTTFGGTFFDAFVSKFNATGTGLIYSTFLGGSDDEWGRGIALDTVGNTYVTGYTESDDFPITLGAFQTTYNGGGAAFVTKLNATGTALEYSTFLGNSSWGNAISLDTGGNAHVTGYTSSASFPITPGAFQTTYNSNQDAFVTKLNATGTALVYSTFLGGDSIDADYSIALDINGNAYVTGYTESANFPTTTGAFQTTYGGREDAFVTQLNATGTALVYSTFLGSNNAEWGWGITLNAAGNAYVTGETNSYNFPTTLGAFQTTSGGSGIDVFVTKLNVTGTALEYSTFLGGSGYDTGVGIALDADGNAYVTGRTTSVNFPTITGAFQTTKRRKNLDPFMTKLHAAGTALVYSTFLRGASYDWGSAIALDAVGNAYLTGGTSSPNFPTTSGAFQTTIRGYEDVFVSKLSQTTRMCAASPIQPLLNRPKNGYPVKETQVWLSWKTANCKQTYNIVVRRDSPTGKQIQAQKKLNVARFLTKSLKSGKTYYWQVEACNAFGCTKSDWWRFTLK
ncbi:MAG: SBBP repeat-containing protein [Chloroflexi bacterium]|nr:SBBP repeat-containing protein [Chloroflexota bacterium]